MRAGSLIFLVSYLFSTRDPKPFNREVNLTDSFPNTSRTGLSSGAIWYRQNFSKMADFNPLGHKLPIPNSVDPPQPSVIHELGRQSNFSALPAVGIEHILAKSHFSVFWTILEGGVVLGSTPKT